MIEAAMYVALGFCTAGLIGLAILPAFYRRAARLTEEALRAVNPSSYAEVRAAQDQERARHAVEFRRVERQLDAEREKAAKFQLEASSLKLEIEAQQKAHVSRIAELEMKIAAMESDQQAIDLLTKEVERLKTELSDAEKALAESWAETKEEKTRSEKDDSGWLPAADTMALTTITGLEAEVATLKAKLARYEPTVAGEVEASRDKAAKSRLAELEGQLVDTESQYVAAQAEVTRLSMLLESANISETEQQKRLSAQIEKVTGENMRQQAELKAKERVLARMSGQMVKLQKDLAAVPALVDLRKDFRALAARLSAAQSVSVAPAPKTAGSDQISAKPQAAAPQAGATQAPSLVKPAQSYSVTVTSNASVNGGKPDADGSQPSPAANPVESPASAKTAEIASAAQALVSRIVASQRGKDTPEPKDQTAPAASVQSGQRRSPEAGGKAKSSKQNKKDVA